MLYAPPESRAVLETEYTDACGVRPAWADLVDQAGLVDFDLSETKTAFSITTRQQVPLLLFSSDQALLKCLLHLLLLLSAWQSDQADFRYSYDACLPVHVQKTFWAYRMCCTS